MGSCSGLERCAPMRDTPGTAKLRSEPRGMMVEVEGSHPAAFFKEYVGFFGSHYLFSLKKGAREMKLQLATRH